MSERKVLRFLSRTEQAREAVMEALADAMAAAVETDAQAVAVVLITEEGDASPIIAGRGGLLALVGALDVAKSVVLDTIDVTDLELPEVPEAPDDDEEE